MLFKVKNLIIIIVLFAITLTFTLPEISNINLKKKNYTIKKAEEKAEVNYIQQDARLTTEMRLKRFIPQIKKRLKIEDANSVNLGTLKKDFPQILSISSSEINNKQSLYNQPNTHSDEFDIPPIIYDGEQYYVNINLPIRKANQTLLYKIKVNVDEFSIIKKKQQSRMFTVTHLQNNRWKTNPTKYKKKKNLSLNLVENLPDINPNPDDKGISHYIKNEIVIKFKEDVEEEFIQKLLSKYNIKLKKSNKNTIIAHCPEMSTKELLRLFENLDKTTNSKIEYIEPHFIYLTNDNINKLSNDPNSVIPNDSLYSNYQWNLPLINTEQGWELTRGKENVIVAVIDTGVDLNHDEFKGKLVKGYNFIHSSKPPMDDDGHGTHVAGIISANTNNHEGIAGITWFNKIMPIKVLDQSGAGTLFDVAEGIFWATDNGAKVINLSLGNYAESKFLHDAIKYAYSKNVVLIAASGNDNINELGYPASYPEVLAVSAIDSFQNRAEFSNYGSFVDVVAPGVNIPSTYPNNEYAALSGTSMASPHVAGLAGLIRSINPNLTNKQVNDIIKNTATDLGNPGKDDYYGFGQINVAKAINHSTQTPAKRSIFLPWLIKKTWFRWSFLSPPEP